MLSDHAVSTARTLQLDLFDIALSLEQGEDCEHSRRRAGTRERCIQWGHRRVRFVVTRTTSGWFEGAEVWLVVTIGEIGRS